MALEIACILLIFVLHRSNVFFLALKFLLSFYFFFPRILQLASKCLYLGFDFLDFFFVLFNEVILSRAVILISLESLVFLDYLDKLLLHKLDLLLTFCLKGFAFVHVLVLSFDRLEEVSDLFVIECDFHCHLLLELFVCVF